MLEELRKELMGLMRKTIRPEFLNRIDEVIMFTPLTHQEIKDIVKLQINRIREKLVKNNIELEVTDEAMEWISEAGFDPQFGARPIKRIIQREISNNLSKAILSGAVYKDRKVLIDCRENQIVFTNANS